MGGVPFENERAGSLRRVWSSKSVVVYSEPNGLIFVQPDRAAGGGSQDVLSVNVWERLAEGGA